jgi:methyl-accepting chemotaxis protein
VTQQNASASEQMTATADELAGQAEELQASISFFRTDATAAGKGVTMTPVRASVSPPAARRAPQSKPMAKAATARKAGPSKAANVSAQQARVKGFALDLMQGGPDAGDVDFKAYA